MRLRRVSNPARCPPCCAQIPLSPIYPNEADDNKNASNICTLGNVHMRAARFQSGELDEATLSESVKEELSLGAPTDAFARPGARRAAEPA